jgi:hypothetical protein
MSQKKNCSIRRVRVLGHILDRATADFTFSTEQLISQDSGKGEREKCDFFCDELRTRQMSRSRRKSSRKHDNVLQLLYIHTYIHTQVHSA